jgi:hypothetical protein
MPVEIERKPHAVDQGEELPGVHGRGQNLRYAAHQVLFEMHEPSVISDQIQALARGEMEPVAQLGELKQHCGKGLAGHGAPAPTSSCSGFDK